MSDNSAVTDDRVELTLLARRITVELEAFSHGFAAQHHLQPVDVRAIVFILDETRRGVTVRPAALSRQLGLTTASVTAMLDRLEGHGHVVRQPHPTDRRGITVHVGPSMMKVGQEYFGGLQQRMMRALAAFSDAEIVVAKNIFGSLIEAIEAGTNTPAQPSD